MTQNNKLKAVAIVGPDQPSSFQTSANYYNNKDYLVVGDGESSIS